MKRKRLEEPDLPHLLRRLSNLQQTQDFSRWLEFWEKDYDALMQAVLSRNKKKLCTPKVKPLFEALDEKLLYSWSPKILEDFLRLQAEYRMLCEDSSHSSTAKMTCQCFLNSLLEFPSEKTQEVDKQLYYQMTEDEVVFLPFLVRKMSTLSIAEPMKGLCFESLGLSLYLNVTSEGQLVSFDPVNTKEYKIHIWGHLPTAIQCFNKASKSVWLISRQIGTITGDRKSPFYKHLPYVSHANVIVIDHQNKTIELFDPHGALERESHTNLIHINVLQRFLAFLEEKKFFTPKEISGFRVLSPLQLCPRSYQWQKNLPLCAFFGWLYLFMRILCPCSRENILQSFHSSDESQIMKQFYRFILEQYQAFVAENGTYARLLLDRLNENPKEGEEGKQENVFRRLLNTGLPRLAVATYFGRK